jgi:hypothetical protein
LMAGFRSIWVFNLDNKPTVTRSCQSLYKDVFVRLYLIVFFPYDDSQKYIDLLPVSVNLTDNL